MYIGSLCISDVGAVREPSVVTVIEDNRWPSARRPFGMAGEKVRSLTCLQDSVSYTVFSYRLWIFDYVSFFGFFKIQQT